MPHAACCRYEAALAELNRLEAEEIEAKDRLESSLAQHRPPGEAAA